MGGDSVFRPPDNEADADNLLKKKLLLIRIPSGRYRC
jgi:hypothetical protein